MILRSWLIPIFDAIGRNDAVLRLYGDTQLTTTSTLRSIRALLPTHTRSFYRINDLMGHTNLGIARNMQKQTMIGCEASGGEKAPDF